MKYKFLTCAVLFLVGSAAGAADSNLVDENKTIYLGDGFTFNPTKLSDVSREVLIQAKVLADQDQKISSLEKRCEVLEKKITRLLNILKLQKENKT